MSKHNTPWKVEVESDPGSGFYWSETHIVDSLGEVVIEGATALTRDVEAGVDLHSHIVRCVNDDASVSGKHSSKITPVHTTK